MGDRAALWPQNACIRLTSSSSVMLDDADDAIAGRLRPRRGTDRRGRNGERGPSIHRARRGAGGRDARADGPRGRPDRAARPAALRRRGRAGEPARHRLGRCPHRRVGGDPQTAGEGPIAARVRHQYGPGRHAGRRRLHPRRLPCLRRLRLRRVRGPVPAAPGAPGARGHDPRPLRLPAPHRLCRREGRGAGSVRGRPVPALPQAPRGQVQVARRARAAPELERRGLRRARVPHEPRPEPRHGRAGLRRDRRAGHLRHRIAGRRRGQMGSPRPTRTATRRAPRASS